jgi:tRNA dimethylallyltransferase
MSDKRIICICGPTGVGKTASSLAVARRVQGAVVNFDSRQVYADFPIITAQPSVAEQSVCPHRLFGFLPTIERLTAPGWARMAAKEIDDLHGRGLTPILVGGTGFYLRALLEPLAPIPEVPPGVRESVLARCREIGAPGMHEELKLLDPESAERIHPNDTQRVTRAIEVHEATGRPLSEWRETPVETPDYEVLKFGVGLDMKDLELVIGARIGAMLEAGAVEEARRAWARCPVPEAPGWSGIGCAELLKYLLGEMRLEEARELWFKKTRAYAKRQMTWFRRDPDIRWFGPGDASDLADASADFAR